MDHHATLNEIDSLSMGELQRQLVTWVEEKGLLNELRAYLRKKMIFLLKDTILDQKTSIVDQICVTPKLQALALLVAEYLLSQKLFYSLSVFSTEVPTITHVNKFCQQIQNANDINENSPKLDSNEITRILEAVGISGHSELVNNIMLSYTNATDRKESLIGSILENISTAVDKLSEKNVEKLTQGTNTDEFLEGKRTINSIADLNLLFEDYHLKQHQSAVFMFIDKEHARIKSEEKAKYKSKLYKHQKTLFQEVKTREEYVLRKLNEAEVRLVTQKQQIEANLKRKQNHLQELADELGHIHNQLSRREEILSSLKQEAISALKEKPSMNICDQCKSCDHLKKQEVTKSAGQNISQEQKILQASDSERLCERKLFSDIILGLQKENTALKDETLKHRTSIMKLKCKLAKTKSVHENKRPFYTSQLCLPVTQLIRPSSLSPIISSDKEHIPSSNSSSKSDITSVKNASSSMRIQIVGAENTENIKRKRSSLKNDDSELSTKTKEVHIHASSPVADLTRDINKYELKENNESKFTIDIAKKSETLDFSKKHKKQK
ncbi:uncharacterized protein LOC113385652 [Ctenocephalides felis]|uniref:uncharacterized protein LOC113385652 n=1 Tax=Ctenocephalides felis TaxID=7515 RepID=UPI000E6E4134|nr:uncharacterized protein LOC113385652 [Ctenocephalides felis]